MAADAPRLAAPGGSVRRLQDPWFGPCVPQVVVDGLRGSVRVRGRCGAGQGLPEALAWNGPVVASSSGVRAELSS